MKENELKIAFIVHTAYPEFIGGREHHVHHLATALSGSNEVYVITGSKNKDVEKKKINGYTLINLPMISIRVSKNPLQIYRIAPRLFAALRETNPDIIHAFEYGSWHTSLVYFYSKKYKTPFVLTIYGYQFKSLILKMAKKIYDYFLGRHILGCARSIFCPSFEQYREALVIGGKRNGLESKLVIQPNCIPISEYKDCIYDDNLVKKYELEDKLVLLALSRILPRKGINYLISSLQKVIFEYKIEKIKLLIVGPDCGETKNIRSQVKELNLDKHVAVVGPVEYNKIKNFLGISDVFVLPSLYEGLPLSLLESMAAGKPVIFSKLDCSEKLIVDGKHGLLVGPADVESLTKAIIKLSCDAELRERLGLNAKAQVQNFDIEIESRNLSAIYEIILKKNPQ
jgi:glycosyltransferase involved in cell wall biosynthesis